MLPKNYRAYYETYEHKTKYHNYYAGSVYIKRGKNLRDHNFDF